VGRRVSPHTTVIPVLAEGTKGVDVTLSGVVPALEAERGNVEFVTPAIDLPVVEFFG
jgi:hypothetical protein